MEKGKIILIEGTDCSGKETQSKKLIEKLNEKGAKAQYYSFPNYSSPTGKIVGLPYLGKPYLARDMIEEIRYDVHDKLWPSLDNSVDFKVIDKVLDAAAELLAHGWFKEGATNVDSKVSSLLYAADRLYNLPEMMEILESGNNIVLDRYVYSNMAHQGGKEPTLEARQAMFEYIHYLEFVHNSLPDADVKIFLHMPTPYANILKAGREEEADENERDLSHLIHAENTFLEVASLYDFDTVSCIIKNNHEIPLKEDIKSKEEIHKDVLKIVEKKLVLK